MEMYGPVLIIPITFPDALISSSLEYEFLSKVIVLVDVSVMLNFFPAVVFGVNLDHCIVLTFDIER
jgi:hypothetical protein